MNEPSNYGHSANENLTIMQVESITAIETLSSSHEMTSIEISSRLHSAKRESEVERDVSSEIALEDTTFEVLQDLKTVEIHESSQKTSLPTKGRVFSIQSFSSEKHGITYGDGEDDNDELVSNINVASVEDSTADKICSVAAKKPTHNAPGQSWKAHLSQTELAAKYAEMTLEDRAFEILKDLGMIEIHEFSPGKLSTLQEEKDNPGLAVNNMRQFEEREDNEVVSIINSVSTDPLEKETRPKRQRFSRPIRRAFEKSKEKLFGTSRSPNTSYSLSEAVRRARQQPKSPSEEALLSQKYGQMTIEDRAYAILRDLGMIESV